MAGVKLVGLTKRFGDEIAVNNVNLTIEDREFLVLVGPSGCGKTTILRMIAGLEEPTDGEIWIGDRVVNDLSPKDRDIAMVFQNYALYPHMTVFDNMAFALKMSRFSRESIEERVLNAARMLDIEGLLQRKPRELSGGQRQRVALGRAIVREPQAFLMDEPLSNLDAKLRAQTRTELIKLHRRLGITTIYVTHDQQEAMTMGDRIVIMRHGVLQQVDTPLAVYNHPANRFVAGFIGSPPMNFLEATLDGQNGDIYVDTGNFRVKLPPERSAALMERRGEPVTFGIRPADIHLRGRTQVAGAVVSARVEVVEPLGAESILYLASGDDTLVATVDSAAAAEASDDVELVLDMERAHLFDPKTEAAIV